MVIVCRQTGYVLAIPCQEKGLDSKSAASLFLDRCVHMFGLPKEFFPDNASIINSEFLKDLFAMSGARWPTDHRATDLLNELSKVL